MSTQEVRTGSTLLVKMNNLSSWLTALSIHSGKDILVQHPDDLGSMLELRGARHYDCTDDRLSYTEGRNPDAAQHYLRFGRIVRRTTRIDYYHERSEDRFATEANVCRFAVELRIPDSASEMVQYSRNSITGRETVIASPQRNPHILRAAAASDNYGSEEGFLPVHDDASRLLREIVREVTGYVALRGTDGLDSRHPLMPSADYDPLKHAVPEYPRAISMTAR